jgi:hypothetical protein
VLEVLLAAGCVTGVGLYGCERERAGRAEMQAYVADSVAQVNAEELSEARQAIQHAVSKADAAVARADEAASASAAIVERAAVAASERDQARAELLVVTTAADSLAALVQKSDADDALLAARQQVIDANAREIAELRKAVSVLRVAADSVAREQFARDARVEAQLRAALNASQRARPGVTRVWVERVVWVAAGYGLGKVRL